VNLKGNKNSIAARFLSGDDDKESIASSSSRRRRRPVVVVTDDDGNSGDGDEVVLLGDVNGGASGALLLLPDCRDDVVDGRGGGGASGALLLPNIQLNDASSALQKLSRHDSVDFAPTTGMMKFRNANARGSTSKPGDDDKIRTVSKEMAIRYLAFVSRQRISPP
jgi:hypothetical protein